MAIKYDAIVIGSGPNGLAAAILLQEQGLSVLLIEAKPGTGGGMRTEELTLPGFKHDVCAAVHPLFMASPFLSRLPLHRFGLRFIQPALPLAHPFDSGDAACLSTSFSESAEFLKQDRDIYRKLLEPLISDWDLLMKSVLSPFQWNSAHFLRLAKFALHAFQSAERQAKNFKTMQARGLWAGVAAHAMLPLSNRTTGPLTMILMAAAHKNGWPIAVGGTGSIAQAMEAYFRGLGGEVLSGYIVRDIKSLPPHNALLCDIGPHQLAEIAGDRLSAGYRSALRRYRYGMGVFKIDWALRAPVPFTAEQCRLAGTVHLGNSLQEVRDAERMTAAGMHVEKPFVLFSQPSVFDASRAPAGYHTAWAYCHVPGGSSRDMTSQVEAQVERFAPGFKDLIVARHVMNAQEMESYNLNYVNGDINGGVFDLKQFIFRPVMKSNPYRTSRKGIYICSSSTPPGGGVHGMCGFNAGSVALKDMFNISLK